MRRDITLQILYMSTSISLLESYCYIAQTVKQKSRTTRIRGKALGQGWQSGSNTRGKVWSITEISGLSIRKINRSQPTQVLSVSWLCEAEPESNYDRLSSRSLDVFRGGHGDILPIPVRMNRLSWHSRQCVRAHCRTKILRRSIGK